jgi:Ca2+-binding RTX toxin-like protein
VLIGGAGADVMDGGAGLDVADYSAAAGAVGLDLRTGAGTGAALGDVVTNVENVIGGASADVIIGNDLANRLEGGAGDDQIDGYLGDDVLIGGAGADLLAGNGGLDTADYSGSQAGVTITINNAPGAEGNGLGGDAQGDRLTSIERVIGSAFADTLTGDAMSNIFVGGAGADVLNGGDGVDTAEYSTSASGVTVALTEGATTTGVGGDAQGDTLTNIENVIGSAFADRLTGSTIANRLEGGAGEDILIGGGGADRLIGGDGVDTIDYSTSSAGVTVGLTVNPDPNIATVGSGGDAQGDLISQVENIIGSNFNDTLVGSTAANALSGGAGNDTLAGGGGADTLDGGAGVDYANYASSSAAVSVQLSTSAVTTGAGGDAQGDQLSNIEGLIGSAFNDLLIGSTASNYIDGGAGNDTIRGGAGGDQLIGGDGVDTLDYSTSQFGVAVLLSATSATAGQTASGQAGVSDAAGDVISGFESIIGSNASDLLIGSAVSNKLVSGSGNDVMRGGSGADILSATGAGAKLMYGEGNADGGVAGADQFRILGGSGNVIADYQAGEDIFVNSATTGALTQINLGGTLTWAVNLTGSTHQTFVALGSAAALTQTQATQAMNTLLQNDLFFNANLIA